MKWEYDSREYMYETVWYVYVHQKTGMIFEILNKIVHFLNLKENTMELYF